METCMPSGLVYDVDDDEKKGEKKNEMNIHCFNNN